VAFSSVSSSTGAWRSKKETWLPCSSRPVRGGLEGQFESRDKEKRRRTEVFEGEPGKGNNGDAEAEVDPDLGDERGGGRGDTSYE
jgi:hypothetical protein